MGRTYERIEPAVADFIGKQHMFFVGTAPSGGGHVNVSPKGMDSFRILDDHRVAYLDLTGSGIETIAHVRENGRLTVMFCAVEGPPRIVRVQGSGSVVTMHEPGYAEMAAQFPNHRGARAVIVLDVDRVADSCGYSVPLYEYVGQRTKLDEWAASMTAAELVEYRAKKNARSIDGLPALAD